MSFFDPTQALGLPKGSVRAVLALIVVVPFLIIALTSGLSITGDQFIGVLSLVLTAYFVQRAAPNGQGEG